MLTKHILKNCIKILFFLILVNHGNYSRYFHFSCLTLVFEMYV